MRRMSVGLILCAFMLVEQYSFAQEAKSQATTDRTAWKFEFTVAEVEDGKVINERRYSMLMIGQGRESIRAGNQVPVVTTVNNTTTTQYMDVALSIDCQLFNVPATNPSARVSFEISRLASEPGARGSNPLLRFVRGSSTFALNPGKKEVVLNADDVNSKRQYQVSVLATKLN
jgi:hypothetical protein